MSSDAHLVSVVIVNYNGKHFLAHCLDSLQKVAFQKWRHEIIVVDNASSDGSQEWLRQRTDIRFIESPVNTGFTGGNNLGAQAARGDILFLLNNDTRVETCLDPMVDELLQAGAGVVGCLLHYGDQRLQFSAGYEHTPLRIVLSWLGLEKRAWLPSIFKRLATDARFYAQRQSPIAWVSGAALMTHTALWRQLGGLDERYFMYCEDVDFCRRVRLAGHTVTFTPQARITHFEGGGKPWLGIKALQRSARSYVLFVVKHFGGFSVRLMALCLGTIFLTRTLAFYALSTLKRTPDARALLADKAQAFGTVGSGLLKCALTGQIPELP